MRRLLHLLVPLALLVAACGDDDADDATPSPTTTAAPAAEDEADRADDGGDAAADEPDEESATSTTAAPADDSPAEDAPGDGVHEAEGIDDPGVLLADLTGDAEVPGPGDDGATGRFEAELVEGSLCIDMAADSLAGEVTAAHVHEGAAGAAGPPVVDIGTPTAAADGGATWTDVCVPVDGPLVERMATEPDRFYVNIHSASFPDGAVRGQLALASVFDRQLS
ncbi:MAG TPA: CHRD domain-containing protein [Acidimicrobiales bacterium]|nr:CHRD domain-containing protein [Acidimicrobiales bacterium]